MKVGACLSIAFAFTSPMATAADIFYEPFSVPGGAPSDCYGRNGAPAFPPGWTLFNVDGRTPDAEVGYVNDAWIVREDFKFDTAQCAAFSTSWYAPPGQADDWMWSPPIVLPSSGGALSWRAVAYDPAFRDGYEVRVKTGDAPTLLNQADSTVVHSTAAEVDAWTSHLVDLSAFAGQTVYVGFRNASDDKFLLLVDDVRVRSTAADIAARASAPFATDYPRIPAGERIVPSLALSVENTGGAAVTQVGATATPLLEGAAAGAAVSSARLPTLAIGADAPLGFDVAAPYDGDGAWTTRYVVSMDQADADPSNDAVEVAGTIIGGPELARWEGAVTGLLGIGAGSGGEIGIALGVPSDGYYGGARFTMLPVPPEGGEPPAPNPCPGFDYVLNLRSFDTANARPGDILDTTVPVPCEYDQGGSFDVAFAGGGRWLTAGTYVLTAVEPAGGPTLTLAQHDRRFAEGSTWVTWPTVPGGGWRHAEDFGPQFRKTFGLSLLKAELPIFVDGFDGAAPAPVALRTSVQPAPRVAPGTTRTPFSSRLAPPGS